MTRLPVFAVGFACLALLNSSCSRECGEVRRRAYLESVVVELRAWNIDAGKRDARAAAARLQMGVYKDCFQNPVDVQIVSDCDIIIAEGARGGDSLGALSLRYHVAACLPNGG